MVPYPDIHLVYMTLVPEVFKPALCGTYSILVEVLGEDVSAQACLGLKDLVSLLQEPAGDV